MKAKLNFLEGALNGTAQFSHDVIGESFSFESAIHEFLHGAYEHGKAKLFIIDYNEDKLTGECTIRIFNNGNPMSYNTFKKFCSNFHCHITKDIIGDTISTRGYGTKAATISLCNNIVGKISEVKFTNYYKDGTTNYWIWKVNREDADNSKHMDEPMRSTSNEGKIGFECVIKNCKYITEEEFKSLKRSLSKSFTNDFKTSGPKIQISYNGGKPEVVDTQDPMYFNLLEKELNNGENIYTCQPGIYNNKSMIWDIRDYVFEQNGFNDKLPKKIIQRVVYLYINTDTAYTNYRSDCQYDKFLLPDAGIYPLLKNLYLEHGGNITPHFGSTPNGGGAVRCRISPIITNEVKDVWKVKLAKMNGITPFTSNENLRYYYLVEKDGNGDETITGKTIYECLKEGYTSHERKLHDQVSNALFNHYRETNDPTAQFVRKGRKTPAWMTINLDENLMNELSNYLKEGDTIKLNYTENIDFVIPPLTEDARYFLTEKSCIIKRTINSEGDICHNIQKSIPSNITISDVLYSMFDFMVENDITTVDKFQFMAKNLKLNHYDEKGVCYL